MYKPGKPHISGTDGYVVLAACASPEGDGGVFSLNGSHVEQIESMQCCSLAVGDGCLFVLRWSQPGEPVDVFVYDQYGLKRSHHFAGLGDAHQISWDGTNFILVSTATNSVIWVGPNGTKTEWKAPGDGDCWHINGVFVADREVYISAFGRFAEHRGWLGHQRNGRGIIFKTSTGEDVVSGLNCPHHPKFLDGYWLVCNASTHPVVLVESETGHLVRCVQLNGWTRGLAVSEAWIFAGVSVPRHDPVNVNDRAYIAVISRDTWKVEGMCSVDSREIGDISIVPVPLAESVRRGLPRQ
jgi:hypothetical protein